MSTSHSLNLFLALLTASAAKYIAALLWRKQKESKFVYVGKVSALNLYPVKSCSPINLQTVRCTSSGFIQDDVHDR